MSAQPAHDDDALPEETQGYKLSQPKQSLAEYQQMDLPSSFLHLNLNHRNTNPSIVTTRQEPATMPGLLFSDGLGFYQQVRSSSPRSSRPDPDQREAIRNRVNPLPARQPLHPLTHPALPIYPHSHISPHELLPGAKVHLANEFERGEVSCQEEVAKESASSTCPGTQSPLKQKKSKLNLKFFFKDKKSLAEKTDKPSIGQEPFNQSAPEPSAIDRAVVENSPVQPQTLTEHSPELYQGDESLQRYKESLGLGGGGKDLSNPNDPRVCIIDSLSMESHGRDPVTIDLSTPGSEATLKDKPFKVKEGAKFTMVAKFRVQHEILSGLQYVQVVKRKGIRVSKDSEMLGSFAPNTDKTPSYTKQFQEEDAPSGMLARGHYNASSTFVDDDKKTHLAFEWSFDIAKDW
ncbi:hypothetical protein ACHAQA_007102 [Verticillium albo-atrum]